MSKIGGAEVVGR